MIQKIFASVIFLFLLMTTSALANISLEAEGNYDYTRGVYYNNVKPGDKVTYKFKVTNLGQTDESVTLYSSDVKTGTNGGYEYKFPEETLDFVGLWFNEKPKELVLKPKESNSYSFSLKVPNSIDPGQYIGAIIVARKIPSGTGSDYRLAIKELHTLQTVLDFNSEVASHEMDILDLKHERSESGLSELHIGLRNLGTILEKPHVKLEVWNDKETVLNVDRSTDSFYGGIDGVVSFPVNAALPSYTYSARVTIQYNGQEKVKEFSFKVTSSEFLKAVSDMGDRNLVTNPEFSFFDFVVKYKWFFIFSFIIFLLIILFLLFLILYYRRKKQQDRIDNIDPSSS